MRYSAGRVVRELAVEPQQVGQDRLRDPIALRLIGPDTRGQLDGDREVRRVRDAFARLKLELAVTQSRTAGCSSLDAHVLRG